MEVVSISNLVSSENEKTATTCNFQTMAMNSFVIPHALMRGQMGDYAFIQTSYSQFHDGRTVKKHPKKHIYTKSNSNIKIKIEQQ